MLVAVTRGEEARHFDVTADALPMGIYHEEAKACIGESGRDDLKDPEDHLKLSRPETSVGKG